MNRAELARRMNRIWEKHPHCAMRMSGRRAAALAKSMENVMTQSSWRVSQVRADGSLGLAALRLVTFAVRKNTASLENFAALHGWTVDCEEGRFSVSPRGSKNTFATDSISEAFAHVARCIEG